MDDVIAPWLAALAVVLAVVAAAVVDARRRRREVAAAKAEAERYILQARDHVDRASALLARDIGQPGGANEASKQRRPFINAGEWAAGRMYVAPDYYTRRVMLSNCRCEKCRAEVRKAQAYDALLQRWSPHETGEATQ